MDKHTAKTVAIGDPVPLAQVCDAHVRAVVAKVDRLKEARHILGLERKRFYVIRRRLGLLKFKKSA